MSDDVARLVELLERWRDGGGLDRMGVAVDAGRQIRGLSPQRKRALAAEVAERVAPQLVPQIRAEQGDLSAEQVAAVVDLLRRADREQIDDLVTALRTGDVDASLALVDDTLDTVASTRTTDPSTDEGGPTGTTDEVEQRIAAADERVEELLDDAIDTLDGDEDLDVPAAPVVDEEAVRAAAEAAAAARAERWKDVSRVEDRPAYQLPEVSFDIDVGELELPDPTVATVAPLSERRHELPGSTAPTVQGSTTTTRPSPGAAAGRPTLAPAPTPVVVAAVTATPDGYRRRRAALAAIREHRLTATDDVLAVLRTYDRDSDRAWVAGAALDAGLLAVDELDGLALGGTTLARLRRRAE